MGLPFSGEAALITMLLFRKTRKKIGDLLEIYYLCGLKKNRQ
jgi:hypothetical protein